VSKDKDINDYEMINWNLEKASNIEGSKK